MKRTSSLVFVCCVAALVAALGLSACGASGEQEAAKEAFTGTWDLVELSRNGEEADQESVQMLSELGMEVYLDLNEDATAQLMLFGTPMDGTWEAASTTSGTVILEGDSVEMTIEDGVLKMQQDDSSLSFTKGESREASTESNASASGAASASSAAADSSEAEQSDASSSSKAS